MNPLNPQSIYYPQSSNYLSLLGFNSPSSFGYVPSARTTTNYTTRVLLPPAQAISYTPPPESNSLTPSYVSTTNPTYSTSQIQGLLVQQT